MGRKQPAWHRPLSFAANKGWRIQANGSQLSDFENREERCFRNRDDEVTTNDGNCFRDSALSVAMGVDKLLRTFGRCVSTMMPERLKVPQESRR